MHPNPLPVEEELNLEEFQKIVLREQMAPLWLAQIPRFEEPRSDLQPHLWRWQQLRHRILQAGRLIPLGEKGADRRALTLRNPGLPAGRMGTTHTLIAAVQLMHGTEVAPSHRHTPAALRFIKEGKGAFTVVNGEPVSMEPGDLVLTPSWSWHGHISKHSEPVIWMDGLDLPLVHALGAKFHEESSNLEQPLTEQPDESMRRYGGGWLLPIGQRGEKRHSPLLKFPWSKTEERLMLLMNHNGSPYDGLALQYTNPFTGGPVMPTIDCWIQLLRPGEHTKAHRHTGSAIYNVVRGSGSSVINGQRFDWSPGDIFCIPTWSWHEHANASKSEGAILFSMNDTPVLQALGLYREESYGNGDDRQPVTSVFE